MSFVDWNNPPASAPAWAAALKVLQDATAKAATGTLADRQAVEAELTHFWIIPCPSPGLVDQARTLYNQLVLIDLGDLSAKMAVAPAAAARSAQKAAPNEKQLMKKTLELLDALQKQQQQALAAQLLAAQDIAGLRTIVQQLITTQQPDAAK